MAAPIELTRCLVVNGGGCGKTPWTLTNTSVVDGREYLSLSKRDFGFARFVAGDTKACRPMTFLDTLRRLRTDASILCCSGESLFDVQLPQKKRAKSQQRAACLEAARRGDLPATVMVELPAVRVEGEDEVPAISMRVKSSLDPHECVAMEVTVENLTYVRMAMRASCSSSHGRAASICAGVRWDKKRQAFIAKRLQPNGKHVFRTFRPDTEDEVDCAEAQDMARRWADGEDVDVEEADGEDADAEESDQNHDSADENA